MSKKIIQFIQSPFGLKYILFGAFIVTIITVIIILSLSFVNPNNISEENSSTALAAYQPYAGGQVALDITYLNAQGGEVPEFISLPSGQATIRLRYSNTGGLQANGSSITSTLPAGFSYIPGSLRNVFDDSVTTVLADSVFSGQNLTVSPSAGLYNYSNNSSSGVLDIGKANYLRVQKCSVTAGFEELFAAATNTQSQSSNNASGNNCSTYVSGSFLSGFSIPLINNKYLKNIECQPGVGANETYAQFASNTASTSSTDSTGNICASTGQGSFVSVKDIDLLNGRYARVLQCDHPTNDDEFLLAPTLYASDIATNDATGENCSSVYPDSSFLGGHNIDLLDTDNGSGYIEFQVSLPAVVGCKNISASMNSADFSTITDTSTCGLRIQDGATLTDGLVTLSKSYFNGLNNVNSLNIPVGGTITVQLNYSNTSTQAAKDLTISDSFDPQIFDYTSGSAKNCFSGSTECVPLSDALFSTGTITVAPQAGTLGYTNNSNISSIDQGRDRYFHVIKCYNGTYYDNFVAETNDFASPISGSCSDYGLTGYTKQGTTTIDTRGMRYLNMITCEKNGFYDSFPAEATNISGESSQLCSDSGLVGYTNVTSFGVDLRESTNLNLKRCVKSGVEDTYIAEASTVAGASASACYNSGVTGYTSNGGFGINTFNSANSLGYVEYKIRAKDTISSGVYGNNATLNQSPTTSGTPVSTITAESTSSISIILYCDSIKPVNGERNFQLSDAELRTDQDFTCNYDAQICPIVFSDSNLSGSKDTNEDLFDAITVELRRISDNSLVGTIITDINSSQPQCFSSLASGELYSVTVVNPPSPYNTTGLDTVTIESSVLVIQQFVNFGYSDGGVLLDASPEVFFPGTTVSSTDKTVSTTIPYVEVRDLRIGILPWSVSAITSDFTGTNTSQILNVSNRFTLNPQTISVITGQQSNITRGNQYTITSTTDPAEIFNTNANDGNGQYRIEVDIDFNVPAYSTVDNYQSIITFTLI